MLEMDANMKVQCALYEFERLHGIRPNRIVMGYHLFDELASQFYQNYIPVQTLEDTAREKKLGIRCEYQGTPIKVDYDNPDILEAGYMVKWLEPKQ